MDKCIDELIKTVNALKTVEVKGDHWLTMYASVNSIRMVISMLQEGITNRKVDDNAINNNAEP